MNRSENPLGNNMLASYSKTIGTQEDNNSAF